jgi:tetratricopeptide (TPR) repeat protein
MDPRLPGIHFQLGRALLLGSETEKTRDEALQAFQKELVVDPQNSNAWYEIGEIHRRRGQFDQALEAFAQAVRYHAEFEDAQIALGRTLMNLGRPQDALPHLLAAVRLNPTNEVSHFQLASVYKSLGDMAHYQEEMALFQKHHVRPHAGAGRRAWEALRVLPSEVTKQKLDPEAGSQP